MGDNDARIKSVFEETVKKVWNAHEAADSRIRMEQRLQSDERMRVVCSHCL